VTAEFELREIARNKTGVNRGHIDDVLDRLRPALAGNVMYLVLNTSDLRTEPMRKKFEEFLSLWTRLGEGAPPCVLCVSVVRFSKDDHSPEDVAPILESVFERVNLNAIAIKPVTLTLCDLRHFDDWEETLNGLGKKIIQREFQRLKSFFDQPFRLATLKDRLMNCRIYE
jgi:hypothetical protein